MYSSWSHCLCFVLAGPPSSHASFSWPDVCCSKSRNLRSEVWAPSTQRAIYIYLSIIFEFILYCAISYYTELCYTVPYCTIKCHTALSILRGPSPVYNKTACSIQECVLPFEFQLVGPLALGFKPAPYLQTESSTPNSEP